MSNSRTLRRLAVFALIGALGFGGGWAAGSAWPGDGHTKPDHHEMQP
jgi:hypothetical protein